VRHRVRRRGGLSGGQLRWKSILGAVLAASLAWVALALLDFEPDPVRVPLLVALIAAVSHLMSDALGTEEPVLRMWAIDVPEPVRPVGQDARLSFLVRVLAQHQVARHPDARLAECLAELADRRLQQRHGVRREQEPQRAAELLGPDLSRVLTEAPGRRLSTAEIDRHLRRIEEL
jgi:hypothetical protein